MTLYKRPKSKNYYMDFRIQGTRINRSTGTTNKELAVKVEQAVKDRTLETLFVPPPVVRMTLKDYIEEVYLDKWVTQISGEQTYDRLQVCLQLLGNVDILTIDRRMLKTLRAKLTPGRKVATVNRYMAHMKTLLNEAFKDTLLERVPAIDMKPEPKTRDIFYTLSPAAEKQMIDYCLDRSGLTCDMADLIILGLETGMRLGEMLGLKFSENIDIGRSRITLYADMTKTNSHRIIPMSDTVRELLARRQGDNDLVFTGRNGGALRKTTVGHTWNKIKERSGVGGETTPHSLRHTFATRALSNGMNIKYVQTALGHASVKTTERYAHIVAEDMEEAFRKLNGHLSQELP